MHDVETGMSDSHDGHNYWKLKRQVIDYMDYKMLNNDKYWQNLLYNLSLENIGFNSHAAVKSWKVYINVLSTLAPNKMNYHESKNMPFTDKTLSSVHMRCKYLKHHNLRERTAQNKAAQMKNHDYPATF